MLSDKPKKMGKYMPARTPAEIVEMQKQYRRSKMDFSESIENTIDWLGQCIEDAENSEGRYCLQTVDLLLLKTYMNRLKELIEVNTNYNNLLNAVESKFPGKSRYETALSYIKEREQNSTEGREARPDNSTAEKT